MDTGKDGLPIVGFQNASAFAEWLRSEHERSEGIWLKIPKKVSGEGGPSYGEALKQALRFGWIDSQKAALDSSFYLQRFTPRRPKSRWSRINRKKAEVLLATGEMEVTGLAEVDAAKADGRWDAAYNSHATATVPDDLARALSKNKAANAFFDQLSSQNRYAILYRIEEAKRADTRARRITKYVDMCSRKETLY